MSQYILEQMSTEPAKKVRKVAAKPKLDRAIVDRLSKTRMEAFAIELTVGAIMGAFTNQLATGDPWKRIEGTLIVYKLNRHINDMCNLYGYVGGLTDAQFSPTLEDVVSQIRVITAHPEYPKHKYWGSKLFIAFIQRMKVQASNTLAEWVSTKQGFSLLLVQFMRTQLTLIA